MDAYIYVSNWLHLAKKKKPLSYLLWCTFAHSMHFTSTIYVCKRRPFIGWIEWEEVNFRNPSSCLTIETGISNIIIS